MPADPKRRNPDSGPSTAAERRELANMLWGGLGSGEACDFCGLLIDPSDTELRVELSRGDLRFHVACERLWESGAVASKKRSGISPLGSR